MPSIANNAAYLQSMKDGGNLKEIEPKISISSNFPAPPSYPNEPNPRLRTPMPAGTILQPDTVRQFFNSSIPQSRLFPQTASGSSGVGAAIQSQTNISFSGGIPVIPPAPPIPPATGLFYELNGNGDFETMYSINGIQI